MQVEQCQQQSTGLDVPDSAVAHFVFVPIYRGRCSTSFPPDHCQHLHRALFNMQSHDAVRHASIESDRTSIPVENVFDKAPAAKQGKEFMAGNEVPKRMPQLSDSNRMLDHDGERSLVSQEYLNRIDAERKADQIDPFLVEFGPGDPDNPKNWPNWKKWYITCFTALLCFTVAIGSSMITGDLEGSAAGLHVSSETINLSVTLFVAGFGFGPMLFASLSEVCASCFLPSTEAKES